MCCYSQNIDGNPTHFCHHVSNRGCRVCFCEASSLVNDMNTVYPLTIANLSPTIENWGLVVPIFGDVKAANSRCTGWDAISSFRAEMLA